jgi:hypothetical protein
LVNNLSNKIKIESVYPTELNHSTTINIDEFLKKYEFLIKMTDESSFKVKLSDNTISAYNDETGFEFNDNNTCLRLACEKAVNFKYFIQVLKNFKKLGLKEITINQSENQKSILLFTSNKDEHISVLLMCLRD